MAETASVDVTAQVEQLLKVANLTVSPEDRYLLIQVYPKVRHLVERLRIPEARYATPVSFFAQLSQRE